MNIFLHELKAYSKSTILWTCSLTTLAALYVFMFKSLSGDIARFQGVLKGMPQVLRKALSIYVESISNLAGFYSFVFAYIVLLGAIQAMSLGTSIVSKERSNKTADFLLTKPVSRAGILTSKLLAALVLLIITNIVYFAVTTLMALNVGSEFNMRSFQMISATLFFVQLMFLSLGAVVYAVIGKIKSVISVSLSTVFGFFIIGSLGSIIGDKILRYMSPFRYFDTSYIIKNVSYEFSFVIVGIIFVIVAVAASYTVYIKKDIHVF